MQQSSPNAILSKSQLSSPNPSCYPKTYKLTLHLFQVRLVLLDAWLQLDTDGGCQGQQFHFHLRDYFLSLVEFTLHAIHKRLALLHRVARARFANFAGNFCRQGLIFTFITTRMSQFVGEKRTFQRFRWLIRVERQLPFW